MTSNDSRRAIMADFYRGMRKPGSRKLALGEVVSRETRARATRRLFHVKQD
jgi:hypothetical protein